jgi:sugar phosphate isomerase/epimerase
MKYAICNETFENWGHAKVCETVASLGYTGLELAPFTLAPRITEVSQAQRREVRDVAEKNGLEIIGLHWLLAKTEGLQLTAPDAFMRQKTADYLGELAKCCRDLGGDIMVFGSPLQRRIPDGYSQELAIDFAVDTFKRTRSMFADAGVFLCLEPLAPAEADFIQTADAAVEILDRIDHPNFVLHLDVKAMSSEAVPIPDLIRRHAKVMKHFHANDANRRGPGFGDVDFRPIFAALKEVKYPGYVSVEVFDYTPDPVTIARESIRYMREVDAGI